MIATTFIRYWYILSLAIQVYQILFFGVKFLLTHFPNGYTQFQRLVTQEVTRVGCNTLKGEAKHVWTLWLIDWILATVLTAFIVRLKKSRHVEKVDTCKSNMNLTLNGMTKYIITRLYTPCMYWLNLFWIKHQRQRLTMNQSDLIWLRFHNSFVGRWWGTN